MEVNNPNELPTAPITDFEASQGELKYLSKDNYVKLKKAIETNGFDIPVVAWIDDNGTKWLLDGHQRQHVLTNEGWEEPIPYITVEAPDMNAAMARLLQITSQYGTITQEGIDNFIATYELPEMEVYELTNFDGIKFYELGGEVATAQDKEGKNPQDYIGGEELRDSMSVSLTFDKGSFVEFMTYASYFREKYGVETVTDAVVQAVKDQYENSIR
jgi:hypothetical protein